MRVLSNVSGNVSIQIKIACKYFLVFSSQWRILLLYKFSLQSIWGLNNLSMSMVYTMFTHFYVQWMLLPQAWLCEDRAVRKLEWGFEISSTQGSPSVNACCSFLLCLPPAALCLQPGTADQLLCPSTSFLIFWNHTVNFPLRGTGTPCCRQVPLRGWADVLEHIGLYLGEHSVLFTCFSPCEKRIWD